MKIIVWAVALGLLAISAALAASPSSNLTVTVTSTAGTGAATILPTPPPGKSWAQTFGDEFNTTFNTSVWDVDHAGGSAIATDTTGGGILTVTIDAGTPATRNIIDTWTTSAGVGNHAFSQRYGYFAYNIKLPTCAGAEFDVEFFGRDNWTYDSRAAGAYAELGVASGQNVCNYRTLRPYEGYGSGQFSFMSSPDVGVDVTLAYHQYGVNWVNDGSAHGSVTMYFDGVAFSGPIQLISPGWDVGMFFDLYWSPILPGGALGGSNGTPDGGSIMQVDWIRAYQAQ